MRVLGIDPGLEHTGWGVVDVCGNQLRFVAAGCVHTRPTDPVPVRLAALAEGLKAVLEAYHPEQAAVEEVFVNVNARTSLKLGQARGICLLVPQQHGVPVTEYAARLVKKSLVGTGRAEKQQVAHMVRVLLPGAKSVQGADATDALAVALTHGQMAAFAAVSMGSPR